MRRTTIFLNSRHMGELAKLGQSRGLRSACLVRIAIAEYLRREKRKQ
jgi:hypothetical protein